jgi:SNF2 family DNA or RNA helicase
MASLPSPEPSVTFSDCEDSPVKTFSNSTKNATHDSANTVATEVIKESIKDDDKPAQQQDANDQTLRSCTPPDSFITDLDVDEPSCTLDDKNPRKRASDEDLAGQAKRKPHGRGNHDFADLSSFRGSFNIPHGEEQVRRIFKVLKKRNEAINELIDEAPEHQKDVTKTEMKRYMSSLNLNITPMIEDGDRRWIVKGLKTGLRTFQALGAGRIRWLENREVQPQFGIESTTSADGNAGALSGGGILADQMGLGSMSCTLAC